MNRHKLGIIVLGIIVAVSCAVGISVVGSPISQRQINFDNTRISDFQGMKFQVEEYYRRNGSLPLNQTDIEKMYQSPSTLPQDPESGTPYTYQKTADTSYQFCTTFSTDSEEVRNSDAANDRIYTSYPMPSGGDDLSHSKGYDCITFTLPLYMLTPTPYYYPGQPIDLPVRPLRKPDPARDN